MCEHKRRGEHRDPDKETVCEAETEGPEEAAAENSLNEAEVEQQSSEKANGQLKLISIPSKA